MTIISESKCECICIVVNYILKIGILLENKGKRGKYYE